MGMVFISWAVLLTMTIVSCICCLCMKFRDMKMQRYLLEMAKKKGMKVDLEKVELKCQSPYLNENCTIMIPDVGYVL